MPPTTRAYDANGAIRSCKRAENQALGKDSGLLDLPTELTFKIIKIIDLEDIKALTRLAMASKSSLLMVEAATGCSLKESQHITKRFEKTHFSLDNIASQLQTCNKFSEQHPKLAAQKCLRGPDLDYLNFDDSLSWLSPLSAEAEADEAPYRVRPMIEPKELKKLIAQARHVRITIPPALMTLMRSEDLQECFAFGGPRFSASTYLAKCPPDTDRNAGGYVMQFLEDQQGCWYMSIYVDGMGQSCALFSVTSPTSDYGEEEGSDERVREFMGDTSSRELDLETFLCHT